MECKRLATHVLNPLNFIYPRINCIKDTMKQLIKSKEDKSGFILFVNNYQFGVLVN